MRAGSLHEVRDPWDAGNLIQTKFLAAAGQVPITAR
jgi:hypothetical protein